MKAVVLPRHPRAPLARGEVDSDVDDLGHAGGPGSLDDILPVVIESIEVEVGVGIDHCLMKPRPAAVDAERRCSSGVLIVPVPVPLPVPEKGPERSLRRRRICRGPAESVCDEDSPTDDRAGARAR